MSSGTMDAIDGRFAITSNQALGHPTESQVVAAVRGGLMSHGGRLQARCALNLEEFCPGSIASTTMDRWARDPGPPPSVRYSMRRPTMSDAGDRATTAPHEASARHAPAVAE